MKTTRHFVEVICGLALLGQGPAHADPQTINWSAQNPGAALGSADGNPLSAGAVVRLGYFLLTSEEIEQNFFDLAFLDSQFVEVGREGVGNFGAILYGNRVETKPASFDVPGAFAQTITIEADLIPLDARFYIWAMDAESIPNVSQHGLFSSSDWMLTSLTPTAFQWGIENVDPSSDRDVYLATRGPEPSPEVGGLLNKLTLLDANPGAGDNDDPDGNGIVALLEEAFMASPQNAHAHLPHMTAPDVLTYFRKPEGTGSGWDHYRAGDLEYLVEASTNLEEWEPASETIDLDEESLTTLASGAERVLLRFSRPVEQGHYFRVRVLRRE